MSRTTSIGLCPVSMRRPTNRNMLKIRMTETHDVSNKIRCGNVTNAARLGVVSKCMIQM